jgi:hypothetical protein
MDGWLPAHAPNHKPDGAWAMAARTILTAARLREVLNYNPKTGEFSWVQNWTPRATLGFGKGRRKKVGTIKWCGRKRGQAKYRVIGIDGRLYFAHRLAWLWMTGKWPKHEVDHRDRDGLNNRWRNLRDVTRKQNEANKKHKRISWSTRDRRWVVHYSFEQRADAEDLVRLIGVWHHKVFAKTAGRSPLRRTAIRC